MFLVALTKEEVKGSKFFESVISLCEDVACHKMSRGLSIILSLYQASDGTHANTSVSILQGATTSGAIPILLMFL